MAGSVCVRQRREAARQIATIAFALGLAATAGAQTLTLRDAADTTLRGGSYANKNLSSGSVLETRASDDAEYKRRVLLKFDTHTTIPMGTTVTSATLTMTVYGGNSATRTLSAYRETESYTETVATWNNRQTATKWTTPGGTIAERVAQASVTATPGSRVTFDVTAMVRNVVKGTYSTTSRYARFVILDAGSSSRDSWRQYYSEDSGTNGPTLTIVLGSSSTTPPPPPPPPPPPSTDCFVEVDTAAELQAAITSGDPCDTIVVARNIVGNFTVNRPLVLTSKVALPTGRIPLSAPLPSIRGKVTIASSGVTLRGIKFLPGASDTLIVMKIGTRDITLDRVIVNGEDKGTTKRGVEMNAANAEVKWSQIVGIWKNDQENQGIGLWDTPGPLRIIDNAIEAASQNIMLGGADPVDRATIPTNVLIELNDLYKRNAWRAYASGGIGPDGKTRSMRVKNLFEVKFGRDVVFRKNKLRGSWVDDQTGYAILLTVRNTGGTFNKAIIERVTVEQNEIRETVHGVQIWGRGFNAPTLQGRRFVLRDNLWVISGNRFLLMSGEPRDVIIDHNTIIHPSNGFTAITRANKMLPDRTVVAAGPFVGFRFTNNLTINGIERLPDRNTYGLATFGGADFGKNCKMCGDADILPDAVVTGNVLAGAAQSVGGHWYPADNAFPTVAQFYAALDRVTYRVLNGAFAGVSTDGTVVGRR